MRLIWLVVGLLVFSGSARAGVTTTTIASILVYEASGQGMVYVYPAGGVNSPPACHGSNGDYVSFAMDRPVAKEYFAMLTAAMLSGANVTLFGKGACIDQGISETLNYAIVISP